MISNIIIISLSGVLSPGPLLISNIINAKKYGYKAGLDTAIGHTIIELPLVVLLGTTNMLLDKFRVFNIIVGIIGGLALITFSILSIVKKDVEKTIVYKPFISGIVFTGLNPFFITWWLTIGMNLINSAMRYSMVGLFMMFLLHIWLDYAWLILTSYITKRGISIIKSKYYKVTLFVLNIVMMYFGILFITSSLKMVDHMGF